MFFLLSLCFTSLPPSSVASITLLPSANGLSQIRCTAGGGLMCMSAQQQRGAMHWRHGGCLITTVTSFLMLSELHVLCACQVAKRKSSEKCYMYRLPSSLNQVCSVNPFCIQKVCFLLLRVTRCVYRTKPGCCSALAMYASFVRMVKTAMAQ